MTKKTLAIISYITLIGWLIAYFQYKNGDGKSPLVKYHLEQALGIIIFSVVLSVALTIIGMVIPSLARILSIAGLLPLILMIFGIIAASNESTSPVPGIGKFFEEKFSFLS
nr:DUF4870 domain-containing protein [uncultured Chitinophaga sp.]